MNTTVRPKVIEHDEHWQRELNADDTERVEGNWPARDGGTQYCHGPKDHQAFVRCGMAAHDQAPGRESDEQREFREIAGHQELRRNYRAVVPADEIKYGQHAEDDHERR